LSRDGAFFVSRCKEVVSFWGGTRRGRRVRGGGLFSPLDVGKEIAALASLLQTSECGVGAARGRRRGEGAGERVERARRRGRPAGKMPFIKVVKNKAYFKRFQVKLKRRRQGKTDYRARKRLVAQDKNKYNTPKYRFTVRFTNRDIICQVQYATLKGDITMASAYSHQLPKYGLKVGLTNYAAAYCTGLLCARRLLKKIGLDETYTGAEEADGSFFLVEHEDEEGPAPFRALLDVGLVATTTGKKVFGAMKGAVDGGLYIPHNEKRFPGYEADKKELDADRHREFIFGVPIAEYMEELAEEEPEMFQRQFASYIAEGIESEGIEEMYENVHAAIRENPEHTKKVKTAKGGKRRKAVKLTRDQKKANLKRKIAELQAARE